MNSVFSAAGSRIVSILQLPVLAARCCTYCMSCMLVQPVPLSLFVQTAAVSCLLPDCCSYPLSVWVQGHFLIDAVTHIIWIVVTTAFVCVSEMCVCVSVTAWCSCQVNRIKSKPTYVNMLCMVSRVHTNPTAGTHCRQNNIEYSISSKQSVV
jgi:hypothetical protein